MKKLSKLKLNDLKQHSILLSKEEQASFVGGESDYDGGWIPEVVCYGIYTYDGGWYDDVYCYGYNNYGNEWFYYIDYPGMTDNYGYGYNMYNGGGGGVGSGDGDHTFQEELTDLVGQLPAELRAQLANVRISYDPNIGSPGQYYSDSNQIKLKMLDYTSLYAEVIHAIQDKYEYCGDNHAAIEYQEHVIGDIEYIISGRSGCLRTIFNNDFPSTFEDWIYTCFSGDGTPLNLNKFLNGINDYISDFQKSHSNTVSYQGNIPSGYNFNWVEMFQKLGISTY